MDRKVLIGIGIGLIIATLALSGSSYNNKLTKAQIEKQAASYGMEYPKEEKVILKKEIK